MAKCKQFLETLMDALHRSGCPINLTLEILGDRWSLIIIRDIMFGNRRHFRELLQKSEEGIASNILADRLKPRTRTAIATPTRVQLWRRVRIRRNRLLPMYRLPS